MCPTFTSPTTCYAGERSDYCKSSSPPWQPICWDHLALLLFWPPHSSCSACLWRCKRACLAAVRMPPMAAADGMHLHRSFGYNWLKLRGWELTQWDGESASCHPLLRNSAAPLKTVLHGACVSCNTPRLPLGCRPFYTPYAGLLMLDSDMMVVRALFCVLHWMCSVVPKHRQAFLFSRSCASRPVALSECRGISCRKRTSPGSSRCRRTLRQCWTQTASRPSPCAL